MDLRVQGAEQLNELSRALKAAGGPGEKGLRKELLKGIRLATKPMKVQAKKAARSDLPRAGGLNKAIARSSFTTKTRPTRNPGVTIVVKGTHGITELAALDRGRIRHRVFGRGPWVTQDVKPHVITGAFQDGAPQVRIDIVHIIEDVGRRIARST